MEKPVITATQRLAVPGPSPEMEALRRTELRRYKALATGLLLIAAVIFFGCRWWEAQGHTGAWVGFVRAAVCLLWFLPVFWLVGLRGGWWVGGGWRVWAGWL